MIVHPRNEDGNGQLSEPVVSEAMVQQFRVVATNGTGTLLATGEIDMCSAPGLWEALSGAIAGGQRRLVVDLSGVSFIDSQGLSVLLRAYKAVAPEGGTVTLRSPRPQARKVLEISGVTGVLELED
jgi:anti-sigma B factor antagonist